jgi:hypothetical protein
MVVAGKDTSISAKLQGGKLAKSLTQNGGAAKIRINL